MFARDTFVQDKISELKRNVTNLQMWATSTEISEAQYRIKRCKDVNKVAIEALTGIEIKEKSDDLKTGKTHRAPTMAEVAEVASTIQDLVNGVERLARETFDRDRNASLPLDEDVGVPAGYQIQRTFEVNLNAKAKELKNQLLGDNSISREYFDGMDCMKISQIGEKIRKDTKLKKTLIIGGIVLGVMIIGTAVFFAVRHYRRKSAEEAGLNDELQSIADRQFETMETDPDVVAAVDATSSVDFGDVPHVKI